MTIAIPVLHGRISPVLDAATRLLVVNCRGGKEITRRQVVLDSQSPEELVRGVAELNADVLLCAAVSEPLRCALEQAGVRLHPHLCGDAEMILRAFHCGRLGRIEFRMPGCWGFPKADHAGKRLKQRKKSNENSHSH